MRLPSPAGRIWGKPSDLADFVAKISLLQKSVDVGLGQASHLSKLWSPSKFNRTLTPPTIGEVDVVQYPDSVGAGIKEADIKTATFKTLGEIKPAEYFAGEK
jgi:hypothetical protein